MKIAVTGGAGLVGRFFVEDALARGDTPVVLGRHAPAPGFFSAPVAHQPYALGDRPNLAAYDAVIHCAFSHVPGLYRGGEGDDPGGFIRDNLDGTIALFESAKQSGVPRLFFLSTRAVYGAYPDGTALTEDLPPKPVTLYGEIKWQAEKALAEMTGAGFAGHALRATGVYGPAGPGQMHKWADLFADFRTGREIAPRQGTELHGEDLAAGLRLIVDAVPGAWNLSDILLDRRDLLAMVARLTGITTPLPAPAEGKVSAMRCARMETLGWRPGGMDKLKAALPALI